MMQKPTRRAVLQRGGVGLASVLATSAGCLDRLPFNDDQSEGKQPYTAWLYAPDILDSTDRYPVVRFDPDPIEEHWSQLSSTLQSVYQELRSETNFWNFESVRMYLEMGLAQVYRGEYTRSEVVLAFQEKGWEEYETYHGYSLFRSDIVGPIGGIGDTAVILKREVDSLSASKDLVKAVIDAERGEVDRYTDQNEAIQTLTTHLPNGGIIWTGTNPIDPTIHFPLGVIGGGAVAIDGEMSLLTLAIVFETDEAVDRAAVEQYIRSETPYADDSTEIKISREDQVALAEMDVPTSAVQHPQA